MFTFWLQSHKGVWAAYVWEYADNVFYNKAPAPTATFISDPILTHMHIEQILANSVAKISRIQH